MKQKLLSISACALRSCLSLNNCEISFERIHVLHKKCTPVQIMCYQSALQLHKVWNRETLNFESISMLDQITLTSRQTSFLIFRNNSSRIGMNTTANKFYQLTSKIKLETQNFSFVHYKKIMKVLFLKYGKT